VTAAERGMRLSVMAVYAYQLLRHRNDPDHNDEPDYNELMNPTKEKVPSVNERLSKVCIKLLYFGFMETTSPNG